MTDASNTPLPLLPSYDLDVDESYIRSRDPDLLRCLLLDRSMTARNGRPTNIKWAGCAKNDVKLHDGVRCRVMDWEIGKPVLFMPPFEFKPIEEQEAK